MTNANQPGNKRNGVAAAQSLQHAAQRKNTTPSGSTFSAIILWELRRRRTAIIWWVVGSVTMTTVIMALFPSIRDQAAQMNQVINQLPAGLRELKAGTAGIVDVGDPASFINSQLFYATLPIMWIILAITRGSAALGREEQTKTLELLLAQPISRISLLTAKITSVSLELMIVGAICLLVILAMAPMYDMNLSAGRLAAATLYTTLFSLSFGIIALTLHAAGGVLKRAATALAVVIGFGGYIVTSLSGLTDWLDVPVKFMPYHYFNPLNILHGQTPRGLLVYLISVVLLCTILATIGFRHRDIE